MSHMANLRHAGKVLMELIESANGLIVFPQWVAWSHFRTVTIVINNLCDGWRTSVMGGGCLS